MGKVHDLKAERNVRQAFEILDKVSADWWAEDGIQEMFRALVSDGSQQQIEAALLLAFEEGVYRGFLRGREAATQPHTQETGETDAQSD